MPDVRRCITLTREGITDCVLIERDELTSGTTWHSAAQVTNFGPNQTMIGLKSHSIALYRQLADDPDYPINYHHGTGGLRLASNRDHMDGYHHFASLAAGMGVDMEVIDAAAMQSPASADHHRQYRGCAVGSRGWRYRSGAIVPGSGPAGAQGRGRGSSPHAGDRPDPESRTTAGLYTV